MEGDKAEIYIGKKLDEEDLLRFSFELNDIDVIVYEGSAAYLVELRKKKEIPGKDWTSEQVGQFLFQNVKLSDLSAAGIAERLKMSETLKEGQIFSTGIKKSPVFTRSWNDLITLFVGTNSINLILFKAQPDRAALALPHEPKWLSGAGKSEESQK